MDNSLLILSGLSGVGKSNLLNQFVKDYSPIPKYTTRSKRIDDVEQHLISTMRIPENCDIKYSSFGIEYGINTYDILYNLKNGVKNVIFLNDFKSIEKLKKIFKDEAIAIWIDLTESDIINDYQFIELNSEEIQTRLLRTLLKNQEHNSELFDLNIQYSLSYPQKVERIKNYINYKTQLLNYSLYDNKLITEIEVDLKYTNSRLLDYFSKFPEKLYELSPRNFEHFVAELLDKFGYQVSLTPMVKDGGYDIRAIKKDGLGEFLYLIECKKYSKERPVGIELVRQLYTTKLINKANKAGIITTSHFTKGAIDLKRNFSFEIELNDFEDIKKWLSNYNLASH